MFSRQPSLIFDEFEEKKDELSESIIEYDSNFDVDPQDCLNIYSEKVVADREVEKLFLCCHNLVEAVWTTSGDTVMLGKEQWKTSLEKHLRNLSVHKFNRIS